MYSKTDLGQQIDDKNSAIIQKRLNKVLETNIDNDKEVLEALNELSIFFTENTLISRRNLRSQIEKRSLSINEDFVSAFRKVKETLDTMHTDVMNMSNAVSSMSTQLQNTKAQTHHLIQQTTKLQAESDKISMKQSISSAFIREFQLSETELATLRNSTEMSSQFFNVLDRVDKIMSEDCKLLVQSGHETLASDIQDQMTLIKETALDKIYRWCQIHCKDMEVPDMCHLLARSMGRLQDHNILFSYIIAEFCTCRRAILVRNFIDALTSGGSAIEAQSHDPDTYIRNMLAWLQATLPREKFLLDQALRLCSRGQVDKVISESLANISEGVTNPLRVRIEKILTSNTSPIALYSVTSHLRYYQKSIGLLIPNSSLDKTLVELVETSEGVFVNTLQRIVRMKILEKVEAPGSDLHPSPGVTHLLNLLREMLGAVQRGNESTREGDTRLIVSNIVEPLLQTINLSASRLSTVHMSVYLLNSIHTMTRALENHEHIELPLMNTTSKVDLDRGDFLSLAREKLCGLYFRHLYLRASFSGHYKERLAAQCDVQVDTLTSEQSSSFVVNLNLAPMYTILQEVNNKSLGAVTGGEPLSRIPGMEVTSLNNFLRNFENFLSNPGSLVLPQINLILNRDAHCAILSRSCQVVCAIYRQLYEAVLDPHNMYENATGLLSRTPAEIKTILDARCKEIMAQTPAAVAPVPVVQEI